MTLITRLVDRTLCWLVGLVSLALGVAAITWQLDRLPARYRVLNAPGLTDAVHAGWWPWALAGLAAVLILLGLWWLAAHLPRAVTTTAELDGSDPTGRLTTDVDSVAKAAASALAALPCVTSAKGTAIREGRQAVVQITVSTRPADLIKAADAAGATRLDLASALSGTPVPTRVLIRVHKRSLWPSRRR